MATPGAPERAVFFVGVLAAGRRELDYAARELESRFGPAALGSPVWPFEHTGYYRDELGERPLRAFLSFPGLFPTERLAEKKLATNAMEREFALRLDGVSSRPINLDPGYLTLAKLVLASAKNYAHRIHLRDGIYAEVTLQYRGGGLRSLPWTFPDYASGRYDGFFLTLRKTLEAPQGNSLENRDHGHGG